ncbi:MAG: riboflavin synthase [Chloroflexota bacterium]|nr:riboflavin synthase [Chloroflexota bacterium]MDE2682891.1 riboflavin synthase [Chloroflexota bacterium]
MFTGIVEEVGRVSGLHDYRFVIDAKKVLSDVKIGDSISVNGACLTVVEFDDRSFTVDLAPETLRRTSLGETGPGSAVNLERALSASDRMGGHIVQGHVDGTGAITGLAPEADCYIMEIESPEALVPYIVEKGFIAVDGISLTVVQRTQRRFTISVIPFTMQNTNLHEKSVGDRVNLEADILAKYVESLLQSRLG